MSEYISAIGLDHISIRVKDSKKSMRFYNKLLTCFGFKLADKGKGYAGWSNGPSGFWVEQAERKFVRSKFHRKNPGLNHIAFRAVSRRAVDDFYKNFLLSKRINVLYGGPREVPRISQGVLCGVF